MKAQPVSEPALANVEVEQALLGAVLINNEAFGLCAPHLTAGDFFYPLHREIWDACAKLIEGGHIANPFTLKPLLPADADLGGITVGTYIARLVTEATTVLNAADYAVQIRGLADTRKLIAICEQGAADLRSGAAQWQSPRDVARMLIEEVDEIAAGGAGGRPSAHTIGDVMSAVVSASEEARAGTRQAFGVPFGIPYLDELTCGMQPGDLVILAGLASMGKTALATNVARAAAQAGHGVGYFSLEMMAPALGRRIASDMACTRPHNALLHWRIKKGDLDSEQFERLQAAHVEASKLPLIIDDSSGITVSQIRAKARRMAKRFDRAGRKLGMVVVDHLGLVKVSDRYKGNRNNEVGEISSALKDLAKELGCPVLALCQLNRAAAVAGKEGERPQLHQLRDSGNLEQDADTVLFVFRESYALERKGEAATSEERTRLAACERELEIIIAKQRDGQIATVKAWCDLGANAVRHYGFGGVR